MREYLAILIALGVGVAIGLVLVAVARLIGPSSLLVQRDRLPAWWHTLTAWARSRSLRVWCPDPAVAIAVAEHLRTDRGRRLSRLGVSIAPGPWAADVLVVDGEGAAALDASRLAAPSPVATVELVDAADGEAFADALVALAAAHRWPDSDRKT